MSETIEFVNNYSDLSTERGFQFEFHCNRCGTGYRTSFRASTTGTVAGVLDAASSLFGGVFSSAANIGGRVHSAAWERAHDQAFRGAIEEIRPEFVQCPHCQSWVCRKSCWNDKRGLCKSCAPDLGVEMAAAQASRSVQEVWDKAQVAEEVVKNLAAENWREDVRATCPKCGEALPGKVKFCPSCGAKIEAALHCTECGAKLAPGTKFCQECGTKVAARSEGGA